MEAHVDGGPPLPAFDGANGSGQPANEVDDDEVDEPLPPVLLPPGLANHVRIVADPIRVIAGTGRRVRVRVFDIHGQSISATTTWTASSPRIRIEDARDPMTRMVRIDDVDEDGELEITVLAKANGGAASATAKVIVQQSSVGGAGRGIPEPTLVEDAGRAWRSRLSPAGWEVNIGHPDYRALAVDGRARVRYLVALFAKDLAVSTTHPGNEAILEQVVTVIVLSERNLLRAR